MNDMLEIIIYIFIAWFLLNQTLSHIANICGNAFLNEFGKMNKTLDLIAGFLEEIRDKLND